MKINGEYLKSVSKHDLDKNTFYVPYGITKIESGAFKSAKSLKQLVIPSSVLLIEDGALDGLSNLEEVFIGSCLRSFPITNDSMKLKTLAIDSSVSNETLDMITSSLYNFRNINALKIYYKNCSIGYKETDNDLNIRAIKKLQTDRFGIELVDKSGNYSGNIIIDTDQIRGYNKTLISREDKYFDYLSLIYEGRFDIIMDWEEVMEHNPNKYGTALPPLSILKSIPTNTKCIKEFLLKQKSYNSLMNNLKLGNHQKLIFNRLLYFIGYFDGNSKHSKEANTFINKITNTYDIKDVLYYFDFLKSEVPYNKDFVPVLFNSFDYIFNETEKPTTTWNYNLVDDFQVTDRVNTNTFKEVGYSSELQIGNLLIKQIYDSFDLIYKESITKQIPLEGKNVVDLLSKVRYNVRQGNEKLFDEMSKYLTDYQPKDFDTLQDIYDKAKIIYKDTTKKIKHTVDSSKNKFKYEWLDPLDPKNFTLGHRVNCCARLNNAGEGIMVTSVLDPNVSNLSIKDGDKIIAKATAYFNTKKNYILFNNVEIRHNVDYRKYKDIYVSIKKAVLDQMAVNDEVDDVVINMAYNDLSKEIRENCEKVDPYDEFRNNPYCDMDGTRYVDYSGNHTQYYLYKGK